jgi:hypothetical protein
MEAPKFALPSLTHTELSRAPRYVGGWDGGLKGARRASITSVAEAFLSAYWTRATQRDADLATRMVLQDGAVFRLWWTLDLGSLKCSRFVLALVCRDGATAPLLVSHLLLHPGKAPPLPPSAPAAIQWRDGVAWANSGFPADKYGPRDLADDFLQAYAERTTAADHEGIRQWAAKGAVVKLFVGLSDSPGLFGYGLWLFRDAQTYRPLMTWPPYVTVDSMIAR